MKRNSSGSWKSTQNLTELKSRCYQVKAEFLQKLYYICFLSSFQLLENARTACDPSSILRSILVCLSWCDIHPWCACLKDVCDQSKTVFPTQHSYLRHTWKGSLPNEAALQAARMRCGHVWETTNQFCWLFAATQNYLQAYSHSRKQLLQQRSQSSITTQYHLVSMAACLSSVALVLFCWVIMRVCQPF